MRIIDREFLVEALKCALLIGFLFVIAFLGRGRRDEPTAPGTSSETQVDGSRRESALRSGAPAPWIARFSLKMGMSSYLELHRIGLRQAAEVSRLRWLAGT